MTIRRRVKPVNRDLHNDVYDARRLRNDRTPCLGRLLKVGRCVGPIAKKRARFATSGRLGAPSNCKTTSSLLLWEPDNPDLNSCGGHSDGIKIRRDAIDLEVAYVAYRPYDSSVERKRGIEMRADATAN